jgi:hypothetical protein
MVAAGLAAAPSAATAQTSPDTPAATPPASAPESLEQQYPRLKDPRYGLFTPISENGDIAPIIDMLHGTTPADLARRAEQRQYQQQLQAIRRQHFRHRSERVRDKGLEMLKEFTDPAAFVPMVQTLRAEDDVVRVAMLDHFVTQDEAGQGALAWTAIFDPDEALRSEATRRLTTPPADPVLFYLDQALRSPDHMVASNAAVLTNTLGVVDAIPLLISAQVSASANADQGDLAWIAIQTQTAYVQSLETVVGDSSAAFVPVVGTVNEGSILRVQDAVVIIYRTVVHQALVSLSTYDWGQSTASLGYDQTAWRDWYNSQYLPFKNEQRLIDEMAEDEGTAGS